MTDAVVDELLDEALPEPLFPSRPEQATVTLSPQAAWAVVAALWTAYILLHLMGIGDPAHIALKALLMPSLLLWTLVALGKQAPAALAAGLALATAGDVGVNYEGPAFLAGMGAFLGMQVAWSRGFLRMGAWPMVRRRAIIPGAVLSFWLAANLVLGPQLGDLRVPVLVYSLALCTTAILATGVDRRVAAGAAAFLASDLLIGLRIAGIDLPHGRLVVDGLYLLAQYLIVTGWARRVDPKVWVPA